MRSDPGTNGSLPDHAPDESRLRALCVAGWFLLVGPTLYLALIALQFPNQAMRGLGPALVLIPAAATLLLLRAGKPRSAARMLVYGVFVGLVPTMILNGGLQAPQTVAMPLVILLAGWLLGVRHAAAMTVLTLALVLGLAVYPADLPSAPTQATLAVFPIAVVILIAGLLSTFIVHSNDSRLNEVHRLSEALAAEKNQLAQITENMPAMIFHGDRNLICRYANRQFADFFHGGGVPIEGMHLRDILGGELFQATAPRIARVLAGEKIQFRGERRSAAGDMRMLDVSLVPDIGTGGTITGFYALKRDITEQERSEESLRLSEAELHRQYALYEALLAAQSDADIGLFIIDEGKVVFANRALCNLFGYTEDEVMALPSFLLLAHPDDRERILENHRRRLAGERFENRYNIGILTKSGKRREAEITVGIMPSEHGTRILVIMVDISDRIRAEEEMRRSEEKFSRVFRNSPLPISISRLADGRYLEVNDAFVEQFGWGKGEMVGHTSVEVGPWQSGAERERWADMLRKAGRVRGFEATLLTKHGNPRTILIFAERFDLGGEDCILTLLYDDTDRERAEADLRRSEDKFSRVFQASPIAISLAQMSDGTFLDINPAFVRTFGWERKELIGRKSTDVGVWPSLDERERWVKELRSAKRTRNFVVNWRNKAGETRICELSADMVEIGGEPCILAMTSDITDRVRAEEALRTSRARLTEAQRIGRIGSWELDLAGDYFLWSEEINHIFEATEPPGQVNYATFLKNIHTDDRQQFDKTFTEAIAAGKPYDGTYRLRMRDGRIKFLHVRAETHCDADGKPFKVVGTTQDITEQHLARQEIQRLNDELESRVQLRTAELLAANRELESFAYSISHDLRAPLRGIDGFSQLLIEDYRDKLDQQGQDYLNRVRRAAQRMGTLIDDILELSRVTRLEMRRIRVDLSQIAREILEERKQAEPQSRATWRIASDCVAVGDPQLLRVLMQNLLENAWKYSGRSAHPIIEFGCEEAGGNTVFFVRDNGVGFDMQYADRLFRPFQRLHSPEEFEGTGVGLATVARVASRHGGRVWAESTAGQGTIFRFTLG